MNPPFCRVNSSDTSINPSHPWFNVFWFDDINLALEECQASSGIIHLEAPAPNVPYDVRITANVVAPSIVEYSAKFVAQVTVTILSSIPFGQPSPTLDSGRVTLDDTSSVAPMFFSIIPGVFETFTSAIEVKASFNLPPNVPVGVPTLTPAGWLTDVGITFTFTAPPMVLTLPNTIVFNLSYTSPPFSVTTTDSSYTAFLTIAWNWVNAPAHLVNRQGRTLLGIGSPTIRCNAHSPSGPFITIQNINMLHADPCIELNVNNSQCPCLAGGPYATWQQQDVPTPSLSLVGLTWDGNDYQVLAIDGFFYDQFRVLGSAFIEYRLANPGYVVRVTGSAVLGCCGGANCSQLFVRIAHNQFVGDIANTPTPAMGGNVVLLRNITGYDISFNTMENVCCIESVHPTPAAVDADVCSTNSGGPIICDFNQIERTHGTTVNTRVPPTNCYWTAYNLHKFPIANGISIADNSQTLTGSSKDVGAAVCLRVDEWPVPAPKINCKQPLADIRNHNNTACTGVLFDIVRSPCPDTCIAASLNCFGDNSDVSCQAVKHSATCAGAECHFCNGNCSSALSVPWYWGVVAAIVALILLLMVLFCYQQCCLFTTELTYDGRFEDSIPLDPAQYNTASGIFANALPRPRTDARKTALTPEERVIGNTDNPLDAVQTTQSSLSASGDAATDIVEATRRFVAAVQQSGDSELRHRVGAANVARRNTVHASSHQPL